MAKSIGTLRLAGVAAVMLFTWGWLLPRLAEVPMVHQAEAWMDQHQQDASAMFYSELPAFEQAVARVRSLERRHPQAWWGNCEIEKSPR